MDDYPVVVSAGSLRSSNSAAVQFPHRWTDSGVTVDGAFTGAHLLHLSIAGCVLNDLYREAVKLDITLHGVRVTAQGGFDQQWASTGIDYSVEIDSTASAEQLADLLALVDDVAEIPKAMRRGAVVRRSTRNVIHPPVD